MVRWSPETTGIKEVTSLTSKPNLNQLWVMWLTKEVLNRCSRRWFRFLIVRFRNSPPAPSFLPLYSFCRFYRVNLTVGYITRGERRRTQDWTGRSFDEKWTAWRPEIGRSNGNVSGLFTESIPTESGRFERLVFLWDHVWSRQSEGLIERSDGRKVDGHEPNWTFQKAR